MTITMDLTAEEIALLHNRINDAIQDVADSKQRCSPGNTDPNSCWASLTKSYKNILAELRKDGQCLETCPTLLDTIAA